MVNKLQQCLRILPPADDVDRYKGLIRIGVTTRSTLGAVTFDTGGILVDHGWLRILGACSQKLPRNIADWNAERSSQFLLVADDVVGGFFALNGGGLGKNLGKMYYLPPHSLEWEEFECGYTKFLKWTLGESSCLETFYKDFRWDGWEEEIQQLDGSECFMFCPFLWTKEGSVSKSRRSVIPVKEAWACKAKFLLN